MPIFEPVLKNFSMSSAHCESPWVRNRETLQSPTKAYSRSGVTAMPYGLRISRSWVWELAGSAKNPRGNPKKSVKAGE